MKIASIDIGSNTVILLIIEICDSIVVFEKNYYRIAKLGKNILKDGRISKERVDILFSIMYEFKDIISTHECDEVIITATNALRIASNGDEIAISVSNKMNAKVNIIPGETEAYYSFLGATYDLDKSSNRNMVIDIGGGSTEIIIGEKDNILFKKSFQIGTVSLSERFISDSKPKVEEIVLLEKYTKNMFSELDFYSIKELNVIAVGGTPTTLSSMLQNLTIYDNSRVEGTLISFDKLSELAHKLSTMTAEEILDKYKKIVTGRNDVIFSGVIILKNILSAVKKNGLIVSSKGLRYGVVYSKYLNSQK